MDIEDTHQHVGQLRKRGRRQKKSSSRNAWRKSNDGLKSRLISKVNDERRRSCAPTKKHAGQRRELEGKAQVANTAMMRRRNVGAGGIETTGIEVGQGVQDDIRVCTKMIQSIDAAKEQHPRAEATEGRKTMCHESVNMLIEIEIENMAIGLETMMTSLEGATLRIAEARDDVSMMRDDDLYVACIDAVVLGIYVR